MTAAKSKTKKPDIPPKVEERKRREKATSSKPEKKEKESSKTKMREEKSPIKEKERVETYYFPYDQETKL